MGKLLPSAELGRWNVPIDWTSLTIGWVNHIDFETVMAIRSAGIRHRSHKVFGRWINTSCLNLFLFYLLISGLALGPVWFFL